MFEEWRLVLLKSRDELASDISFDLVAPCLIERGIISADEYSKLRYEIQCQGFNESKKKL